MFARIYWSLQFQSGQILVLRFDINGAADLGVSYTPTTSLKGTFWGMAYNIMALLLA